MFSKQTHRTLKFKMDMAESYDDNILDKKKLRQLPRLNAIAWLSYVQKITL